MHISEETRRKVEESWDGLFFFRVATAASRDCVSFRELLWQCGKIPCPKYLKYMSCSLYDAMEVCESLNNDYWYLVYSYAFDLSIWQREHFKKLCRPSEYEGEVFKG